MEDAMRRQIEIEQRSVLNGVIRYRDAVDRITGKGGASSLVACERLMLYWLPDLTEIINIEKDEIRAGKHAPGRHLYGPILDSLDAGTLALITIGTTIDQTLLYPSGAKISSVCYAIGRYAFSEIHYRIMQRLDEERQQSIRERLGELNDDELREERIAAYRCSLRALERKCKTLTPTYINSWMKKHHGQSLLDRKCAVATGGFLLSKLVEIAFVPCGNGGLTRGFVHGKIGLRGGRTMGVIRMAKPAKSLIDEGHERRSMMRPVYEPMIVEPRKYPDGGYLRVHTPLVPKAVPLHRECIERADLTRLYRGLDAVNACPHRINRRVLDVVQAVWERGGGILGIPSRNDVPVPDKVFDDDGNQDPRNVVERRNAFILNERILPSKRRMFLLRFSMANEYRNEERIYYPHKLDFRGRAYPFASFLHHQGNDLCRGLLEHGEEIELDETGEWWLKVHAANMYGLDKRPFAERIAWADEHMDDMIRCAMDPLEHTFWMHADESSEGARDGNPWQFLAACMAFAFEDAARHAVVQVDGTCNGLQHFAAMGLDLGCGRAVNLVPSDSPKDIYMDIAAKIEPIVRADAEKGKKEALVLLPRISRKLVKQPVMTTVYGVTFIGMREQVYETLLDMGVDYEDAYDASVYGAKIIHRAVKSLCADSVATMDWLRHCAGKIASLRKVPVMWRSPIGFPVMQGYWNEKQSRIYTAIQSINLRVPENEKKLSTVRQRNGIVPNFVHSVDASHMFMVATEAQDVGIHASFVHDAYRCHPSQMEELSAIIRRCFYRIHKKSLLEDLHTQFEQNYGLGLPEPPPPGELDLSQVLRSLYVFC